MAPQPECQRRCQPRGAEGAQVGAASAWPCASGHRVACLGLWGSRRGSRIVDGERLSASLNSAVRASVGRVNPDLGRTLFERPALALRLRLACLGTALAWCVPYVCVSRSSLLDSEAPFLSKVNVILEEGCATIRIIMMTRMLFALADLSLAASSTLTLLVLFPVQVKSQREARRWLVGTSPTLATSGAENVRVLVPPRASSPSRKRVYMYRLEVSATVVAGGRYSCNRGRIGKGGPAIFEMPIGPCTGKKTLRYFTTTGTSIQVQSAYRASSY